MIDEQGYRANVGMILLNENDQVLWARRVGSNEAWQFPQGGLRENETVEQGMYRELKEELGLQAEHVDVLGVTREWLSYLLPENYRRYHQKPLCIGQKQKWFLLRLLADSSLIRFDCSEKPEFKDWRWVDYDYPADHVIEFKRDVYRQVLSELKAYL